MKPNGGGLPTGKLLDLINESFGSYDKFRTEFETAGNTAFGSGNKILYSYNIVMVLR